MMSLANITWTLYQIAHSTLKCVQHHRGFNTKNASFTALVFIKTHWKQNNFMRYLMLSQCWKIGEYSVSSYSGCQDYSSPPHPPATYRSVIYTQDTLKRNLNISSYRFVTLSTISSFGQNCYIWCYFWWRLSVKK